MRNLSSVSMPAYTKDFVNFTEPFVYEEADCHVIDMNIVYSDGWYYRFVKDETNKNIRTDRVAKLGKGIKAEPIHSEVLSQLFGVEVSGDISASRRQMVSDRGSVRNT